MALSKEEQERIKKRWASRNSGDDEKTSSTGSSTATTGGNSKLSDSEKERISDRWNKRFDVDDTYVNTFFNDANSFLERVKTDYNKLDYNSATAESSLDYYQSLRQTENDLSTRAWKIQNYLNNRKDKMDEEEYKNISSYLSSFTSPQFSQQFFDARDFYSQFETEDAYKGWENKEAFINAYLENPEKATETFDYDKSWLQEAKYRSDINNATGAEDFQNYSQYAKSDGNWWGKLTGKDYDATYEYINDQNGFRSEYEHQHDIYSMDNPLADGESVYEEKGYAYLTEDEIATYNYYYAKEGADRAQEFLDSIESILVQRKAGKEFSNLEGNRAREYLYGIVAGTEQFASGIENLGKAIVGAKGSTPSSQYVSGMIREDLADSGFKILGNSVGQIGYDLINTSANMLPSILVSTVTGPVGGVIATGASSAGNGYQEMLNLGYDKDQARAYGLMVGAAEGGLQYLMGGISKLGGKVTGNVAAKLASKVDNAIAKVAIELGGSMLSEGLEEATQSVLEPIFKAIASGEDFEGVDIEEVVYSGLLGALSAGMFEGSGTISSNITANKQAVKQYGEFTGDLIQEGLASDPKSESYQLAQKYQKQTDKGKAMSGSQIRNLVAANDAQFAVEDYNSAVSTAKERLTELGESKDVDKIAKLAAKRATGQELTRTEKSTLARSQYGAQVAKEMTTPSEQTEGGTKAYNVTYKSITERVGEESHFDVSESGQTTVRNEEGAVTIAEVSNIDDGQLTVKLEDGREVYAGDIEFANETESRLYSAVADMENITPAAATALVKNFDVAGEQSVTDYVNGIDEAYTYGYYGYSEADLKAGNFTSSLTSEQMMSAYRLGQSAKKIGIEAQNAQIVKMRTAAEKSSATVSKKEKVQQQKARFESDAEVYFMDGKNVVKFDEHTGKYDDKRMAAVNAAKILSKLGIGGKYYFFESYVNDEGVRVYKDANGNELKAPNGIYTAADGSIYIDLNAGNKGQGTTLYTLGHELTHFVKDQSEKQFQTLADLVKEAYDKTDMTMHERVVEKQNLLSETRGEHVTYDEAFEEVVCDAMSTMISDGSFFEKLTEIKVKDKGLFKTIKKFFQGLFAKFKKVYEGLTPEQKDAQDIREMKDMFDRLQTAFAEALVEASENFRASEQIGVEIDADTESVSPAVMNSERTWTESEYVQQREKAAQEIAKAIGVTEKKAKDYIDSINSIAKMIAEDRSRLDYFSSPGRSSFVDNSEYGGSFDFSTLCKKRRLLTGTFTAIQKALPNTALTADEILDIRNRMKEANLEVSCGLCYVEGSRANMGQFAKEFLRLYKQYYPDAWQPNMADVNTPDGIEWVRINHPECYEQYEYFWNHYGTLKEGDKNLFASQQKPKLYQLHTEYKGEILQKFKGDEKVEEKNLNGGIRLQSFSDFEIVHLIDTMQIIMDMSRVGLAGQAYTKVPDFAWALGDTGLKINLSLIAKGVDTHSKLIFDDVEGMPIADAMKLRERYSKNVGTILVAFNDEQLLAAMADDRVDFIIPFHRSQWKKSQYGAMGLPAKTKDYTFMQNEKYIKPQFHEYRGRMVKDKATNYMPNEYWDFSKSGKENAEAYLEMCARNNKRPKFYKLLTDNGDGSYSLKADGSTDGYWKLLIDFKMYDNEGNGSPQMPVKPDFNMEEANRMLETYSGGHSNFPVAQGIVDSFVKDYKKSYKGQKFSERSNPYAYESLTSKPDMAVTTVDGNVPKNRADVVYQAKQNAAKVGKIDPKTGSVSVYVKDIDTDVVIGRDGLKHSIDRRLEVNAPVVLKAGEILSNSIRINEMTPKSAGVNESYVLIGVARNASNEMYVVRSVVNRFRNELASMDVLYAINAKKEPAALLPLFTGKPALGTDSAISIAELLDLVNQYFPDVLPESVLKHYGHDSRPDGVLGKDALYSERTGDSVSNRSLLAGAFEGVVQNSIEYEMLQDYKGRIKELNKLEAKLSEINREIRKIRFTDGAWDAAKLRELESEAKKVAKEINRHDWKLLNLEASEPLRKVIYRERKKEAQKTRDHVKEIQQNKKDRAEQTELRHKIRKKVRDLNKLLNRGNKKLNVKEDMKGFVSKALELADYLFTDHVSNDELIRKGITVRMTAREAALVKETEEILSKIYDHADSLTDEEFTRLDAKRKANEDKLRDLLTAQRNERLQTPVYNLFSDLVTEYSAFKNSKQDAVKAAYNPEVERFLRTYVGDEDSDRAKTLKNMRVADMTTEELWKLDNAYQMVLHAVRTANKLFVKGNTESIEQLVTQIVLDFGSRQIPDKTMAIALQKLGNKIGWNYEKLYYALDRIGSKAFTDLIMNLANSENIVMQDVMEASAFRDQMVEKYGFNNWDVNKEIDREFLDHTGKKFKMTLGQLMSLYAYSRREGAWDHIEYGGFVFGNAALTNPKPADSFKLSKKQCEAITSTLTKEQKGYVEDMQKFLSETMGNKGNEVSMMLYGIKMFGEKNYFPIHIAGQFKAQAQESQAKAAAGFGSMSNAGFTHAQNPNAKAPFVLEGFNEVWSDHVNEMSRYHGTVPALEDLRRVMNRSSYSESTAESTSVKVIMENHFGKEAVEYFDNLYREANSGAITDKLQNTSKKLLGLFRKNSVAYSLSVLVQQPASIVRAYALIDRKYFGFKGVGAITSGVVKAVTNKATKAHTNAYNEMLKYAPGVTMTKEIGGFDTATGGSIRSYLLDTDKSFKQKLKTGTALEKGKAVLDVVDDNAIANLPNVADKIAWIEIWNACKRETLATHKDLKANSDEFMKIVGDRFTEVIRATQVYDSIFAKSPMLKSKNLAVQMLVSFMNEPNTVANMAESAVRDFTKGDRMTALKKAHVLVHSIIFTGVLKSLIYAMRDDEEDETYIEKYIESLTGSLMDDFNPLNYIPILRDAWSVAQGYDVERADMAIVADAISALNKVIKTASTDRDGMTEDELIELDKKVTEASWNLVESLAAFAGIPMKNIRREINAVIDHAKIASANAGKTTAMSAWDTISEAVIDSIPFMGGKSKTDKLYAAIIEGDTEYIDRMKATYKTEDAYHTAVRKALRENDPRIKEAAQAQISGDPSKRVSIAKQIIADGFSLDDVVTAINSEISAMTPDKKPDAKKEKGVYTVADIAIEAANGDWASVRAIKDDIIQTAQKNGKTKDEAESAFESSVQSEAKEAYLTGSLNDAAAKKLLAEYAGKDEEEAASKVSYWSFLKAYPDYKDFTEATVGDYYEFAEPANIPLDVFAQYVNGTAGLATIYDQWGDEVKSKREQVLEVIDSLPLTWQQKDALYLAHGYAESTMWDVPW